MCIRDRYTPLVTVSALPVKSPTKALSVFIFPLTSRTPLISTFPLISTKPVIAVSLTILPLKSPSNVVAEKIFTIKLSNVVAPVTVCVPVSLTALFETSVKLALSVVVIISPLPKALAPDVTSFKSERLMVI